MPRATVETVDHVARLARLSLSDAERDELAGKRQREASIRKSISAEDVLAEAGHLRPTLC